MLTVAVQLRLIIIVLAPTAAPSNQLGTCCHAVSALTVCWYAASSPAATEAVGGGVEAAVSGLIGDVIAIVEEKCVLDLKSVACMAAFPSCTVDFQALSVQQPCRSVCDAAVFGTCHLKDLASPALAPLLEFGNITLPDTSGFASSADELCSAPARL
ncbi:MAG: hypothetical protein MI748_08620 [Opitutales bacterium]|nr:hypothetical protein [Opitutales bacterium]